MSNQYKVIDEKTWDRAMHCMVFRNCIEPAFCVTFEADITNFKRMVKEQGLSFTLAMVYAVCKCANKIEAFRYRFVDGQIVLYEKIDTAFTYLNKDTELFKVVNVPMVEDLTEYCKLAAKTAKEQKEYFTGPLGNDVFQCSPMPWVTYTHISHTNSGKKDNATPLFDWGKYYERDGQVLIPISVQAHHSFVDGLHIGQFAEGLQKYFNECLEAAGGNGKNGTICRAEYEDLQKILELQYLSYQSEADLFESRDIPPLTQTLDEVRNEYETGMILKLLDNGGNIIGSVRAKENNGTVYIGKLMVHPEHRCKGYGSQLLSEIERCFSHKRYELFTSSRSKDNIRLYQKAGYKIFDQKKVNDELQFVYLQKQE